MTNGKHLALFVTILAVVFILAPLTLGVCLTGVAEATLVAPYETGIAEELFDGVIGLEWDDASKYELTMGVYPADVLLKHDMEYFYIAMTIHTERPFSGGFEAFVFFDNGDGTTYSTGDDMLVVSAEGEALVEADYYYRATYDFCLDTEAGGTNDADGFGRYDEAGACYVFELRRLIVTGDTTDVELAIGKPFSATYGWSGY